jgi:hypothetical protein
MSDYRGQDGVWSRFGSDQLRLQGPSSGQIKANGMHLVLTLVDPILFPYAGIFRKLYGSPSQPGP